MAEPQTFLGGRVTLWAGDCREVLQGLDENSIDSCVCDPPYHLTSIVKRFGKPGSAPAQFGKDGAFARASRGFMNKIWDGGDVAFRPETWAEVLRVLKPGAHLIAFGGTRTYHRLACAIEDAGFEIRDCCAFLYGSGFPKSRQISRVLDAKKERCTCRLSLPDLRKDLASEEPLSGSAEQDVFCGLSGENDFTSQFRPGQETPDRLREMRDISERPSADKKTEAGKGLLQPLMPSKSTRGSSASVREQYEGERAEGQKIRGEQSSLEGRGDVQPETRELRLGEVRALPASSSLNGEDGRLRDGASAGNGGVGRAPAASSGVCASRRPRAAKQSAQQFGALAGQSEPQDGGAWPLCGRCGKPIVSDGLGTALKPAMELIVIARKPLDQGSVAANVLRWGTGAINIDKCRVETCAESFSDTRAAKHNDVYGKFNPADYDGTKGRWPANVITDGSEEVLAAFPETSSGAKDCIQESWGRNDIYGKGKPHRNVTVADSGSAARFFYTAKADSDDRLGSKHPTVKPLNLMQYLVRLVTPPKGRVLDCFAGTGTTGEAAWREGFSAVLIEREAEYVADIERRMSLCLSGPDERARESIKARLKGKPEDHGPLFEGAAA